MSGGRDVTRKSRRIKARREKERSKGSLSPRLRIAFFKATEDILYKFFVVYLVVSNLVNVHLFKWFNETAMEHTCT